MCVIAIVEDDASRPTDLHVESMYEQNTYGAGAAWREGGRVHWMKGLNLGEIQSLNKDLPVPYILHFRIPSCGGTNYQLCHPHVIEPEPRLDLTGSTDGYVLFHNGHWGSYDNEIKRASFTSRVPLPIGPWSDTRAMAWLAGNFGMGMLDLIDEKMVAMSPEGDLKIYGKDTDWKYFEGKFIVSNLHWDWRLRRSSKETQQAIDDAISLEREEYRKSQARPSNAHTQMVDRGLLPSEDEDDGGSVSPLLLTTGSVTVKLKSGGTSLAEPTFCGDTGTQGSEHHQQKPIQTPGQTASSEAGQEVATTPQGRGRRQARFDSDGRSREASGGHDTAGHHSLIVSAQTRLAEMSKWARSINTGTATDEERSRRANDSAEGIIHLGRI